MPQSLARVPIHFIWSIPGILFRPFRALVGTFMHYLPGLCPSLIHDAPFGAKRIGTGYGLLSNRPQRGLNVKAKGIALENDTNMSSQSPERA